MQAAYKGDVRIAKLFLEYGADPNLKDNQGRTALDIAKKKNQQEVIDLSQLSKNLSEKSVRRQSLDRLPRGFKKNLVI